LKLEEAQNTVLSHSLTKIQLGSGWKPGSIGLYIVEFCRGAASASNGTRRRLENHVRIYGLFIAD